MLRESIDIKNLGHLSPVEIKEEVAKGARFVVFAYTISYVFSYSRKHSDVYFLRHEDWAIKYSYPYLLRSLLFGWWRFPFGPIYTLSDMFEAFTGKDFTREVLYSMDNNLPVQIHLAT